MVTQGRIDFGHDWDEILSFLDPIVKPGIPFTLESPFVDCHGYLALEFGFMFNKLDTFAEMYTRDKKRLKCMQTLHRH